MIAAVRQGIPYQFLIKAGRFVKTKLDIALRLDILRYD